MRCYFFGFFFYCKVFIYGEGVFVCWKRDMFFLKIGVFLGEDLDLVDIVFF